MSHIYTSGPIIEHICDIPTLDGNEGLLATVIRAGILLHYKEGTTFITNPEDSLQVATISHPAKHKIPPHTHHTSSRTINRTSEVLVLLKGKLKVNFYTSLGVYLCSTILNKGDVIILVAGGHGFEVIQAVEMIEVKQGPYKGIEADKTHFSK